VVTWIYTAIIRPMLTYAAIPWGPKGIQTTAIGKLYQIQRMACLNITGTMRTTPTEAMELITGLTPLDLYVKEVELMAMLRLRTAGVNPLSRSRSIEAKPMARSTNCAASAAGSQ